jgi:transcription elongation factor Elf1
MGIVMGIKRESFIKHWIHKLFQCPTFWKLKASFTCPECGKKYRCYWDGNDVANHGINYCDKCAEKLEAV